MPSIERGWTQRLASPAPSSSCAGRSNASITCDNLLDAIQKAVLAERTVTPAAPVTVDLGNAGCVRIVRVDHGKDYYLSPLYPTLFAVGAVAIAPLLRTGWGRIAGGVALVAAVAYSWLAAPMALPILSPPALEAYIQRIGIAPLQQERSFRGAVLPQVVADQLGWHDYVRQVETAWQRIPPADRADTAIKVENYGEAAALGLYGRGLPPALSGHNQYFLWGLRGQHPTNVLTIQDGMADVRPYCRSSTLLGITGSRYAMAFENGKVIALCKGVKPSFASLWPHFKFYS